MKVEDKLKACDRIVCWPLWCYWDESRAEWQVREERYHSDSEIIYFSPSLADALTRMLDTSIR